MKKSPVSTGHSTGGINEIEHGDSGSGYPIGSRSSRGRSLLAGSSNRSCGDNPGHICGDFSGNLSGGLLPPLQSL